MKIRNYRFLPLPLLRPRPQIHSIHRLREDNLLAIQYMVGSRRCERSIDVTQRTSRAKRPCKDEGVPRVCVSTSCYIDNSWILEGDNRLS